MSDDAKQDHADERQAPSASVVHRAIEMEGEDDLERPSSALAWSGLAAGMSMGFSLVAEGILKHHLPDAEWTPLVSKLGYALGFVIVILGRQQLFTENTLTPILPLLRQRKMKLLKGVLRLWAVVLAANVLGAAIFAFVLTRTEVFEHEQFLTFLELGKRAVGGSFLVTMWRGVFAGWLIALMVWLLPFAESARLFVIVLLTWLVGVSEFPHIVAGSVETLVALFSRSINFGEFLMGFFVPALIGNTLGGVALVAAINHAQVVAGGGEDS